MSYASVGYLTEDEIANTLRMLAGNSPQQGERSGFLPTLRPPLK